jgi:hypothetical protein
LLGGFFCFFSFFFSRFCLDMGAFIFYEENELSPPYSLLFFF